MVYQVFPTFPSFGDPANKMSDTGFSPAPMPDCDPPKNELWWHPGLPEPVILDWPIDSCCLSGGVDDVGLLGENGGLSPDGVACFLSANHLLHYPHQDGDLFGIGAWTEFLYNLDFDDFMLLEPMAFEKMEGTATETAADPSCFSTDSGALLAQTVAQQMLEHSNLQQQEHTSIAQESPGRQHNGYLNENGVQGIQNNGLRPLLPRPSHQDRLSMGDYSCSPTPQQTHEPQNESNASHYASSVISTTNDTASSVHTANTAQTVHEYEYRIVDPSQPQ